LEACAVNSYERLNRILAGGRSHRGFVRIARPSKKSEHGDYGRPAKPSRSGGMYVIQNSHSRKMRSRKHRPW